MERALDTRMADPGARRRLLQAAVGMFTERGYASTSVREIVEAAGVTKPVLYYYFKNKEGIYLQILSDALHEFQRLLEEPRTGERVEDQLRHLVLKTNEIFNEQQDIVRFVHSVFLGPRQGLPAFSCERFHELFYQTILKMVRAGIRNREFASRNEESMALAIVGAFNIVTDINLSKLGPPLSRKDLDRILDVIFAGMKCRKTE